MIRLCCYQLVFEYLNSLWLCLLLLLHICSVGVRLFNVNALSKSLWASTLSPLMRTADFAIGNVGRSTLGFRVHVLGILDLLGCCIQDMSSDIFRTFSDQIESTRFYPRLKQGRDSKILIVHSDVIRYLQDIFWPDRMHKILSSS